ncbi:hypothetical protein LJC59_07310, partial [Desulfovibrio sp. OttesenSCG-928-A18]|nr:hypothetical protein [Desulfovibrio sp. OttesenSCG-928-A18]
MSLTDREKVHHKLLIALHDARKRVEELEAALSHNAAYLGDGIEREGQLGGTMPRSLVRRDGLLEYLG